MPPRKSKSSSPKGDSDQAPQATSPEQDVPKRKRGRINKEQLAQLERLFAIDCSPTVARRREIALQVGCPERQIQVWFQNRRAKAKSNGEKCKTVPRVPSPVKEPPELREAVQTDLAALIQEDDPVVFTIPCTTLTIGGWNRVNYENQDDLMAWICEKKRCFTWFVKGTEYSFKMQVSLDSLKELTFKNADPGKAFLTIQISRPPTFYIRRHLKREVGVPPCWRQCDDWTESKVATRTLRHVLGGPSLPLASVVTYIRNQMEQVTSTNLHATDYSPDNCPPLSATSSTPGYSSPSTSVDDTIYLNPAPSERHYVSQHGWDPSPIPDNQPPVCDPKPAQSTFEHYAEPITGTLGLHSTTGYSDPHIEHDKMRLMGMGCTPAHRTSPPSPLLVPLRTPYPYNQHQPHNYNPPHATHPHTQTHTQLYHPHPGYHDQHVLPGFSELFAPSRG